MTIADLKFYSLGSPHSRRYGFPAQTGTFSHRKVLDVGPCPLLTRCSTFYNIVDIRLTITTGREWTVSCEERGISFELRPSNFRRLYALKGSLYGYARSRSLCSHCYLRLPRRLSRSYRVRPEPFLRRNLPSRSRILMQLDLYRQQIIDLASRRRFSFRREHVHAGLCRRGAILQRPITARARCSSSAKTVYIGLFYGLGLKFQTTYGDTISFPGS